MTKKGDKEKVRGLIQYLLLPVDDEMLAVFRHSGFRLETSHVGPGVRFRYCQRYSRFAAQDIVDDTVIAPGSASCTPPWASGVFPVCEKANTYLFRSFSDPNRCIAGIARV